MRLSLYAASALIVSAKIALADFYANFFDDADCNQNGGIGVDIRNPGCLNEAGRGSVFIPNTGLTSIGVMNEYCLVISKDGTDCPCQSEGYTFSATGFCHTLDSADQSYRFVGEPCGDNTC